MQIFYSSMNQWPMSIQTPQKEGGSPLVQTMLHWMPNTRLQTYTWNDVVNSMVEPAGPTDHATARRPPLSQAKWNRRESNWFMLLVQADNFPSYIHWLQAPSKTTK